MCLPDRRFHSCFHGNEWIGATRASIYASIATIYACAVLILIAAQIERYERVQECIKTSAALTIVDFFQKIVAHRNKGVLSKMLKERTLFNKWQNGDLHRMRRLTMCAQVKGERTKTMLDSEPHHVNLIHVEKIDREPEGAEKHNSSLS